MSKHTETIVESDAIKEWLAKGNKITKCPPGARTEDADIILKWQRGRPKASIQKAKEENLEKKLKD